MKESRVEAKIGDHAKLLGVSYFKFAGTGLRGKSDRIVLKSGVAGFLEIKRPGEVATKLQERFLRQRREDGFPAAWVDNVTDGIKWLDETFGHL